MTFTIVPGATPISDLSELKIPITTQAELDAAEFDNIHRAEQFYFRRRKVNDATWLTPPFLQKIHRAMFDDVWEWAGKYRKHDVLPVGIDPYKIPLAMHELSQDVAYWVGVPVHMTLLEMSARIHHRLAWIHPFPNGNGRFSRFVSNLFLFSFRQPLPTWPGGLDRDSSHRRQYLKTLQEADKGDFRPLVDYLKFLGA
ncbi:MAG TPA: mobile mystery protein B [Chlamydiales bacterium]|nr:mobile mystery protein B [Chlamydiales bacterium]